ncbi:hypothetical protein [Moorena producens]|uniref:hypothetical protein n=1 Tax=Moorena producens TaxID=1155739 RepID=UPI0011EA614A|nr:hypothetical protein [Moorena producens]
MLFDPVGETGILVEQASWWNRHLGGTGILVERASCPFHSQAAYLHSGNPENQDSPLGGALRGGLFPHWRSVLNMMASPP